jgi:hypothetical protein
MPHGLITMRSNGPRRYALPRSGGGIGAWVHPSSLANTRPKVDMDGDKAEPLHVGVT